MTSMELFTLLFIEWRLLFDLYSQYTQKVKQMQEAFLTESDDLINGMSKWVHSLDFFYYFNMNLNIKHSNFCTMSTFQNDTRNFTIIINTIVTITLTEKSHPGKVLCPSSLQLSSHPIEPALPSSWLFRCSPLWDMMMSRMMMSFVTRSRLRRALWTLQCLYRLDDGKVLTGRTRSFEHPF